MRRSHERRIAIPQSLLHLALRDEQYVFNRPCRFLCRDWFSSQKKHFEYVYV